MSDEMDNMYKVFLDYFKLATGIDLSDERIESVDPTKISISKEWDEQCMAAVTKHHNLTAADRTILGFLLLNKSPKVHTNQTEQVKFLPGYIKFKEAPADAGTKKPDLV